MQRAVQAQQAKSGGLTVTVLLRPGIPMHAQQHCSRPADQRQGCGAAFAAYMGEAYVTRFMVALPPPGPTVARLYTGRLSW